MVLARARDKAESNARDRARTKSSGRKREDGPQGELVAKAKAKARTAPDLTTIFRLMVGRGRIMSVRRGRLVRFLNRGTKCR
eukprot:11029896-Heterocapsa_arctica.AAC.1